MELAPDYTAMSSDELDRVIDELTKQEARISCMRTIIQARLDLLIDERDERRGGGSTLPVQPHRLARSLRRRPSRTWGIREAF